MSMYMCHMCSGAHGEKKTESGPLELEFQAVMGLPVCMPGTELGSSGRAVQTVTTE